MPPSSSGSASASTPAICTVAIKKDKVANELDDAYELVPQEGRMVISKPLGSETQVLVDTLLLYKQDLPVGQWKLVFLDGFGCIEDVGVENGRVFLLEDWFKRQLWQNAAGDLKVREMEPNQPHAVWSLTEKQQHFVQVNVGVHTGELNVKVVISGVSFKWPRGNGSRYAWSLPGLYRVLNLTSHGGVASKWVYERMPRWAKRVSSLGGRGQHFFSGRLSSGDRGRPDPVEVYLPEPCTTTFSFMVLLTTFVGCSPYQGGMRSGPARGACASLLDGILRSAARWQPFHIHIRVDDAWELNWPCEQIGGTDVRLAVDRDGVVDLGEFFMLQLPGSRKVVHRALKNVIKNGGVRFDGDKCALAHFFSAVVGMCETEALYKQTVSAVSKHVETSMLKSQSKPKPTVDAIACEVEDLLSLLWAPKQLDFQLMKHLCSWQAATKGHLRQSMALDEANVGGPTLHNSFICLPNNVGFPGAPQVTHI